MTRGVLVAGAGPRRSGGAPSRTAVWAALAGAAVAFAGAMVVLRLLVWLPQAIWPLVIGVAGAALLLYHPTWALPVFVAVVWSGISGDSLGGLPSPVEAVAPLLLVLAVWYALTRPRLRVEVALLCSLLALPVIAASLLSASAPGLPVDGLKELAFLVIVAFCVRSRADVDRVTIALTVAGVILGLGAVYSVAFHGTDLFPVSMGGAPGRPPVDAPRAAGPFREPNFFALSLAALVPIALYQLSLRGSRQILGAVAAASLLAGILATGSRGGLLAAAVSVLAFALVAGTPRLRVGTLAVFLAGAALVPLFAGQTLGARERSISGRASENQVAATMFADHPLAGVGPGGYAALYRDYSRRVGNDPRSLRRPHSLPLQIAAEQGLAGLLGWLGAGVLLFTLVLRSGVLGTLLGKALTLSVASFLLASLFLHGDRLRLLYVLVGLLLVVSAVPRARPEPS